MLLHMLRDIVNTCEYDMHLNILLPGREKALKSAILASL